MIGKISIKIEINLNFIGENMYDWRNDLYPYYNHTTPHYSYSEDTIKFNFSPESYPSVSPTVAKFTLESANKGVWFECSTQNEPWNYPFGTSVAVASSNRLYATN